MTIFHHFFGRLALLFIAIWAGGGIVLLSYFASRWDKRPRSPSSAMAHLAQILFVPVPARLTPSALGAGFAQPSDSRISSTPPVRVETQVSALRSASLIQFDRPAQKGLVSVVIPTHNRAPIIGSAIESALSQTHRNLQIVIADDGSSDDTRSVVESYGSRLTYVHQKNAGVSSARNLGLRHASGEFVALLDSDDRWLPWKIEAEVAALRRHPEAGIVWTDMAAVDETGRLVHPRHLRLMYRAYGKIDMDKTLQQVDTLGDLTPEAPRDFASAAVREGDLFSAILLGNLIHTSTVLFRRSWLERTGGFDESFARTGEDYEFYIRLCSAGPAVFIDAPSTVYRIGAADQLTSPSMAVELARNNLRAVQKWVPRSASRLALSPEMLRRRFSESFAWLGEAELEAGHRWRAAQDLSRSLGAMPRLDRRALLLASCALPDTLLEGLRRVKRTILAKRTGPSVGGLRV
jgi:GT2 family glycosyltransferase